MSEKDGVIICDGCGKHGADCEISEMGQDFCDWRCSEKATLARVGRAFVTGMETLTTSSGVVTGCLPAAFAAERERAEKAEAERDQLKQLHRHALDCVDQVFQQRREIPNPVLPDFCELGEDKFQAVIRLARSYLAEKTRAEKYIAAMREYVEARIADGVCIPSDPDAPERFPAFERTVRATQAIRAIVEEEARRG